MNPLFVVSLVGTAFLLQVTVMIVRVTASYHAVELGFSVFWVGALATSFSVLPLPLLVPIGRFIDRGNESKAVWFGCAGAIIACVCAATSSSGFGLIGSIALLGVCSVSISVSLQILCAVDERPAKVAMMVGNYMVANALGQGSGSFIVGLVGGGAATPPTQQLFWIAVGITCVLFLVSLGVRPDKQLMVRQSDRPALPLRKLFTLPGYMRLLLGGVFSVGAQDLIFVYMPLIGQAHGFSVEQVGHLLATLSISSMLARLVFARLHRALGTWPLAAASVIGSAVGYACVGLPLPIEAVYVVAVAVGFFSGVALTCTVAGLIAIAPLEIRGQANSMRSACNRLVTIIFPPVASVIAAITGIGSVFLLVGLLLAGTGILIQAHNRQRAANPNA